MEKISFSRSTDLETLRFNIDSKWSVHDFSMFFRTVENLYALYINYHEGMNLLEDRRISKTRYIHEEHTPLAHFVRSQIFVRSMFSDEGIYEMDMNDLTVAIQERRFNVLQVSAIKYSSPGFTDIVGVAGVLSHIKELLFHYLPNKEKRIEAKIKEQKLLRIQIQNLKDMGLSNIEIQKVLLLEDISLAKIKHLIDTNKITSIEINEN